MKIFLQEKDYASYLEAMSDACREYGVEIWAYCLMPNHVHLAAVPGDEKGVSRALQLAHHKHAMRINSRQEWQGHLFQGRFSSFPMDERHLLMAARYIEINPVRAGLTDTPSGWKWSSANAHLQGKDDCLVKVKPVLDLVDDWNDFLLAEIAEQEARRLEIHEASEHPLGEARFISLLENMTGRTLRPLKPGRKKSKKEEERPAGQLEMN